MVKNVFYVTRVVMEETGPNPGILRKDNKPFLLTVWLAPPALPLWAEFVPPRKGPKDTLESSCAVTQNVT